MKHISIVTVGMNHLSYLKALLASVYEKAMPCVEFEMIYVDNCSTDGSVEYITEHYPDVKILQNQQPLGFGENNNKGVFASTGKYIAIINPDIVLQEGCIDMLYEYAEQHTEVGILVPRLLNPDGSNQYSVRSFISLHALWARLLSRGKDEVNNKSVNEYLCKSMNHDKIQAVDWSIGAALFMSREIYAELGGFDKDYFLYMEDEDICLRAWQLKRPVIYYPKSKMIHNHLRASSKIGKKMFLHMKSMLTFFVKHGCDVKSFKMLDIANSD